MNKKYRTKHCIMRDFPLQCTTVTKHPDCIDAHIADTQNILLLYKQIKFKRKGRCIKKCRKSLKLFPIAQFLEESQTAVYIRLQRWKRETNLLFKKRILKRSKQAQLTTRYIPVILEHLNKKIHTRHIHTNNQYKHLSNCRV